MRRRARTLIGVAAAAGLVVVAGGCGGDDDGASSAQTREYCDATVELSTLQGPDIDFESSSPEQIVAASKAYATETMRPIADRIAATAPEQLADEVAVLNRGITELEQTGDDEAFFNNPEFEEASITAHEYDLKNCDWETVDVKAVDYKYEDVPRTIDAGIVSFELENDGKEFHEMVIFRRNDGVTETFDQLLELPEEEAMDKATFVAAAFGGPGEEGLFGVGDLQPGSYAMACFVPQGTLTEEALEAESENPPHFTLGMKQEFTVE